MLLTEKSGVLTRNMWDSLRISYDIWIHFYLTFFAITVGYSTMSAALPLYVVLVGGRVELPCDLNVSSTEDEVSLVLWHKGESTSPVYSVDARDAPLPTAKHFPGIDMVARSYFNSTLAPAVLRIDSIKKSEEGVYRCRVEYRRARTETTDMVLKVIVPPREAIIMDEFGQHLHGIIGPFNEGQPLSLACEGEGGDPSPSVKWWRQAELLDDSFGVTPQGFARNDLVLSSLKREDLMMTLTCQVLNSNLTDPVISSVILDMNLKPTDVRITSLYRPLSVERETEVVCVARGARPPAQISWWMGADQIKERVTESSSREDNLTVSTLTILPRPEDDHRNLSCRADNPQLPDSLLEDTWMLNVHYLPLLAASFQPHEPITEHNDVTLTCSIQANPPISELEWLLEGRTVEKTSIGDDDDRRSISNRTLSIPSVGPEHKGHYQCAARNTEGRSISEPVLLRVHYSPKCQSVRSSVYGVGKTESVSVACEVDADPQEVTFFWMLNNSAVSSPLPSSQYNNNGTRRSVATVSPRTPRDYGVLYCWASNSVGKQREPCSFRIIPAGPPEEPRNCATTNRTFKCLTLECEGGEDGGLKQLFQLEVFSTDSDKFLANVTAHKTPTFTVCALPPREALVFVIYAINNKGKSKEVTIRASPIVLEGKNYNDDLDESATITAILGIIIGAATVLILLGIFTIIAIKLQGRRAAKGRTYRPEPDKCDAHLMKECKEPAVTGNQGPDIIPEKRLFRVERTEVGCDITEKEENSSTMLPNTDPENRKYFEYQTVGFTEDHEFLATPKKLRLLQDLDAEVEESGITVETPLISSIPLAAQQWTDHRKEGLRLSTPV